jgi:acyl carrier protein
MKIQKRIIKLVSWVANVPATQILPSTHIREDLDIDSIDYMLLIVKMESLFNVVLTNEQVERIETVKDASEHISRQLAG